MRYVSTRDIGSKHTCQFDDVLLEGLAKDGGLYVPEIWPHFSPKEIADFAGLSFAELAVYVLSPFLGGTIPLDFLEQTAKEAYARFDHLAVTPLVQISPHEFILELFHGPTLAFKDVAMQLVARLINYVLEKEKQHATIICATSGDTGGAAAEAFRGCPNVNLFILFPKGRVSDVQRRMMTSLPEENIHPIEIDGTFDDCQTIVKALFNDHPFRKQVKLSGVNSINWARILAQITYYFAAAVALGAPHRSIDFAVPTGNFGDIYAGFVAKRMGLPINQLIIATNSNDILARTLATGCYEMRDVVATTSPSMDIQISSNFERLLYELSDRDAQAVRLMMDELCDKGSFSLTTKLLQSLKAIFSAMSATEEEVIETLRGLLNETGYLIDPHTSVALCAARKLKRTPQIPLVVLSTASPAKFPETIEKITGIHPALPSRLNHLPQAQERSLFLSRNPHATQEHILSCCKKRQS